MILESDVTMIIDSTRSSRNHIANYGTIGSSTFQVDFFLSSLGKDYSQGNVVQQVMCLCHKYSSQITVTNFIRNIKLQFERNIIRKLKYFLSLFSLGIHIKDTDEQ